VIGVLAILAACLGLAMALGERHFIDLDVYRAGGAAVLHGAALYRSAGSDVLFRTAGADLPFTYPPIAAVLFAPLAPLSRPLAITLFTGLSLTALALSLALLLRRQAPDWPAQRTWAVGLLVTAASPLAEAVRDTVSYGQVNLVLMALISADCLIVKPWWPRGLLVGLAAAVKLTPLGFLLFFVVRREWRAAGTVAVSTLGWTLLGVVLRPRDSLVYWTQVFGQTDRIGDASIVRNQSINGALSRLQLPALWHALLWLAMSALVVAAAVLVLRRISAVGDSVGALLTTGAAVLLVSPVSWSHHWVWLVPAWLVFLLRARTAELRLVAGLVLPLLVVGPQWYLADKTEHVTSWLGHVLANGWLVLAVLATGTIFRQSRLEICRLRS
jgi:alpha-1,2-mannosyltransferase